jgi:hypothetical protein
MIKHDGAAADDSGRAETEGCSKQAHSGFGASIGEWHAVMIGHFPCDI